MEKPDTAKSASALRGDYTGAAADFTVAQDWDGYAPEMHDRWRRLYAGQIKLARQYAADELLDGLERLGFSHRIPHFEEASDILNAATGWRIVAVPGFIPDDVFFDHLAHRRFPVTRWLREEHELDYLVEPDVFHDFFGHVPMLLNAAYARFMQAYGTAGPRAIAADALDMLARIYWYTVEFGLIAQRGELKAYGAGIVSSAAETVFSVTDKHVLRMPFDPLRVMRTGYHIDSLQRCYFVIDDLAELMNGLVELDFGPIYREWRDVPPLPAESLQPGETPWLPKGRAR